MIHEIQRAHTRIQKYVLLIPAILPFVGLIIAFTYSKVKPIDWVCLLVVFFLSYSLLIYAVKRLKQVLYDDKHIYIKSFFGKDQEVITYHDVVELKMHTSIDRRRGNRTAKHTLKYRTKNGIVKAVFYASFYDRQIDLLKRQISPEKLV
jgi:uncharacterized membrane protein